MWDAEKIIQIRKKAILSQQDFAKALGVGFASVVRWEKGEFAPAYKAQRKLATFCIEHKIKFED